MRAGDIWRWTKNSYEHPNEPEHNIFLVIDVQNGIDVLYLASGKRTLYSSDTFKTNKKYLELVA